MKLKKLQLKALLGAASALSLLFTGPQAIAAQENNSPLLSQTQGSQSSVSDLVNAIKQAAGGSVDSSNIGSAIAEAIAGTPGVSQEQVAAALNQMGLTGETLSAAVSSASGALGTSPEKFASAMITDAYMKGGKAQATETINTLRTAVGDETVNKSLESVPVEMLADAGNIANIEPAGGYEG